MEEINFQTGVISETIDSEFFKNIVGFLSGVAFQGILIFRYILIKIDIRQA